MNKNSCRDELLTYKTKTSSSELESTLIFLVDVAGGCESKAVDPVVKMEKWQIKQLIHFIWWVA